MRIKNKTIFWGLCAVLSFAPVMTAVAQSIDWVVAVVNEDAVTLKDLHEYFVLAFFEQLTDMDEQEAAALLAKNKKGLLDKIIDDRLIVQEARRMKLSLPEAAVEERINALKKDQGTEDSFEQNLAARGLNLAMLRAKIREQLLIRSAVETIIRPQIDVPPREVTEYFTAHPEAFSSGEERLFQGLKFQNKIEAMYVYKRLLSGDQFEKLKEQYKDNFTEVRIKKDEASDEVLKNLFCLEKGTCSRPLRIGGQFMIFRLDDVSPGQETTFEQAQDEIYAKVYMERFEAKFKEWVEELRKKAYIKVYEDAP